MAPFLLTGFPMPSSSDAGGPHRVGVVFGGVSGEHAISIRSACTVVRGLREGRNAKRYDVRCFYIDRTGGWWPPAMAEEVLVRGAPAHPPAPPESPGSPAGPGFRGFPAGALEVEIWFPVLHGPNGEDGTVQGLFTLMGVPFVGSGVLGSALGMDKQAMKAAFAAAGLPQLPYECVASEELDETRPELIEGVLTRLERRLHYPCFVKPANMGSSVGITRATDRPSLLRGLREAAHLDPRMVVEQGVRARELECAVLGGTGSGDPLRASVLGEIRFDADWYDYDTKYTDGTSETLIPAPVPPEIAEQARSMALTACRAVAARGMARVDFFYREAEPDNPKGDAGELWVNEINTIPGFTSQSMYPMLWAASGLPLEDLVHHLVQGARESAYTGISGGAAR